MKSEPVLRLPVTCLSCVSPAQCRNCRRGTINLHSNTPQYDEGSWAGFWMVYKCLLERRGFWARPAWAACSAAMGACCLLQTSLNLALQLLLVLFPWGMLSPMPIRRQHGII